jgi:hypothetical protein
MAIEIYKQINGYQNYAVSNFGNVKNTTSNKILKEIDKGNGYLEVGLYDNKKLKKSKIHRLVASHFIENPESLKTINHINGIKTDNRAENLEWNSNRENNCHKFKGKNITSKYVGVHFNSNSKRWISQIKINDKSKHLGSFKSELYAYQARVNFEIENNIVNKYI